MIRSVAAVSGVMALMPWDVDLSFWGPYKSKFVVSPGSFLVVSVDVPLCVQNNHNKNLVMVSPVKAEKSCLQLVCRLFLWLEVPNAFTTMTTTKAAPFSAALRQKKKKIQFIPCHFKIARM